MNPESFYRVVITTIVDRPELRDDSYRPVKAGTTVRYVKDCVRLAGAVSLYDEVLEGEWDFMSEYAKSVRVERMVWSPTLGDFIQARRVCRKQISRKRVNGKVEVQAC